MTPAAICFDATGTLIETAEGVGEVYQRVAREFGVDLPAWRIEDAFRRILARAPARGVEGTSVAARRDTEIKWWSERVRETFQATDSTARFSDFPAFAAALFEAYRTAGAWRLRPGTIGLLEALQQKSRPMAIVSNFDHRLPEILEALDISLFFEAVVIPSTVGRAKPDRVVFETALSALAPSAKTLEALLYVGDDSKETLRAIAELGLQVIDVHQSGDFETLADRVLRAATLPPQHGRDSLHRQD